MSDRELIVRPDSALVQRLSASPVEQFYDWEKRGRGWQIWDCPAYLEPPFRPFFRYQLPPPPPVDDGRQHTFASLMIEKANRWWSGEKAAPEPQVQVIDPGVVAVFEEPELPPYQDEDELIELQIVLPPEAKVGSDTFSAFLVSLAYCGHPLSFEVIGTAQTITVQLACRESDAEQVREQLVAHFPEARVKAVAPYLSELWAQDLEAPAVVVEFGLSREFMLPLKTIPAAPDPLVAVAGALGKLREGEVGVLQVLFESVRHPWAESIFRAVTNDEGRAFFDDAPEMVGLARQKAKSPLFAAVIRVAAKSDDEDRAWQIAKGLGGGLAYLSNPTINELLPLNNEGYDPTEHQVDVILRLTHRGGMLLNTEELVSLVHLPTAAVRAPKLKRQSLKSKAAPQLTIGHELVLGENEHEGETQTVTLSADQRVKHAYLIGASGTGKSTFMLNCILQDIERGEGLAVLDPHGDLIDQILERIPESRWGDVVLFDPSDEEYPIGFNILSAHSETEKQLLSSDLVGVFKRLSTSWGDQMTSVLGNAILSFLESDRGGTLADMRRFLVEKEYRQEFLKTVKDRENVYYWQKEFPLLTGKPQAPLLTRLDTFLRPKLIRHMVAQKENKLDFAEIMNGRKIFLAKLAHGGIGEENAYLLGTLLVAKFHQLAMARQEMKAADRRPFYLFIDEFQNFVTPSMASILAGARKYRLGLVLAHQELRQLGQGATEIASAVLSNPYTRVCFRLGDQDAKRLADGYSFFDAKDLQNLGTGEALCRVERAEYDFNLQTSPLAPVDCALGEERARRIVQLSRQRYATPVADVIEELERGAGGPTAADESEEKERPKAKSRVKEQAREDARAADSGKAEESKVKADGGPPQADATPASGASPAPSPPSPGPSVATAETAVAYRAEVPPEINAVPPPEAPSKSPVIPKPVAVEAATVGRGGTEHKRLQQLIRLRAAGMGWKPTIEKTILSGAGSIDVALEKEGHSIACEICVNSPVEQEVHNIEKCLKAGIARIVSVCEDRKQLTRIRAAAEKKIAIKDLERVQFLTPDELFALIEELNAGFASVASRSGGYNVTESYTTLGTTEKKAKKKILGDALVGSVDELREEEGKKKGKRKPKAKPQAGDEAGE